MNEKDQAKKFAIFHEGVRKIYPSLEKGTEALKLYVSLYSLLRDKSIEVAVKDALKSYFGHEASDEDVRAVVEVLESIN